MNTCKDVMTNNPVSCLPSDTVMKVSQLMGRDNIGSLVVVENEGTQKLIGIVTDRDLALKVLSGGRGARSTKVETVMTRSVVSCHPDDDLQKALDAMAQHQLRRIPVVDNDNKVVGIIAQADIAIRLDEPEKTSIMVKEISQAKGK